MDDWVDYQKAKIDQEEESYRLKLQEEQDSIDSLATNILGIQMERGLSVKSQEGSEETDQQQAENLSNKKNALEKQLTSLEYDLQKLRPEFKMREKRIQGEIAGKLSSIVHFIFVYLTAHSTLYLQTLPSKSRSNDFAHRMHAP
jgi:hypothetical protein